jgi:hypothetical protein
VPRHHTRVVGFDVVLNDGQLVTRVKIGAGFYYCHIPHQMHRPKVCLHKLAAKLAPTPIDDDCTR